MNIQERRVRAESSYTTVFTGDDEVPAHSTKRNDQ